MKKVLIAILILAMAFAAIGCGKKPESESSHSSSGSGGTQGNPSGEAFTGIESNTEDEYIVFKVKSDVKLDENAWIGILPKDAVFTTEAEADEYDIIWTYIDNGDRKPSDDYIFKFYSDDIYLIEDGNYIMVLCDNDDEGKLVLQFPITITGSIIVSHLDNVKVY